MIAFKAEGQIIKKSVEIEPHPYCVLEVALGGELFNFVNLGAFPETMARMYFKQLIAGIKYIHEKGVYHRDLKFENIMLTADLNLKIADFGLSITDKDMKGKQTVKNRAGTFAYMAPEVLDRREYVPASADIFSAGVILFTLYTGNPPFKRANNEDTHYKMIIDG